MTDDARYRFEFVRKSPHGHAVRLVERHVALGTVVLDLGCGFGAVAEPLQELGFTYLGIDVNRLGLEDLRARGFETATVDLRDTPSLSGRLTGLLAGRPLGAVLALDVIEHLVDPRALLDALPLPGDTHLVVSVPNVAHVDVGAKLLSGRWDVMPTGLLDETHLHFFTDASLAEILRDLGWQEVERADFLLERSDQHFPDGLPSIADGAPLASFLRLVRRASDDADTINQFVRCYRRGAPRASEHEPASSVIVLGDTTEPILREMLTCVAAQLDDDFDVAIVATANAAGAVAVLDALTPSFRARLRANPSNGTCVHGTVLAALRELRGELLTFVGAGELVTDNWLRRLHKEVAAVPGRVVRSRWVERRVRVDETGGIAFEVDAAPIAPPYERFDPVFGSPAAVPPLSTFVLPRHLRRLGDVLAVDGDVAPWTLIAYAAMTSGLHEIGDALTVRLTDEVHLPDTTTSDAFAALDAFPILLPPGSARRVATLIADAGSRQKQLDELRASTSWRLTRPLRAAADVARRRKRS